MKKLNEMSVKELRIAEINSQIDKVIKCRNDNVYIPLETIKNFMISCGYRDEDKPFGKPYIGKGGEIFTFTSERSAFGFTCKGGEWKIIDLEAEKLCFFTDYWQPYPQEEWDAMLLDYAKSRGYKNGNYKCLNPHHITQMIDHQRFEIVNGDIYIVGMLNQNKIFDSKTGVWAEIIEPKEEAKDHFVDAAMHAMGVNPSDVVKDDIHFYFGIDFVNVTDEPKSVVFDRLTMNFETIDPNRYTLDEWIEIMKLGLERKKSQK